MVNAALLTTNGDFETGYPGSAQAAIGGWYSVTTGNFWDNAFWDAPDGFGPCANLSANASTTDPVAGSWLYQSIGSSDGAANVPIRFDWGSFGAAEPMGLTVRLYEDTTGTFVAGNNVDVEGALSLVGSFSLEIVTSGAIIYNDSVTFDLSGVGAGNQLYLRFNNYNPVSDTNSNWTYLDNVQVVPEPATLVLLGLGSLVVCRTRLNKK